MTSQINGRWTGGPPVSRDYTLAGVFMSSTSVPSNGPTVFVSWFSSCTREQRRIFLEKVVPLVAPHKLFALMDSVRLGSRRFTSQSLTDSGCCFEEQVKIVLEYLKACTADEANAFLVALEEVDYAVLCEFYDKVASTAGEV